MDLEARVISVGAVQAGVEAQLHGIVGRRAGRRHGTAVQHVRRQQIVRAEEVARERDRPAGRRLIGERQAQRRAFVLRIIIAGGQREGPIARQLVGNIRLARIQILVQLAEHDRCKAIKGVGRLPHARAAHPAAVHRLRHLDVQASVAGINELPLVGRIALGVGVGAAHVDRQIVDRLELAHQLRFDQLPLEPVGILLEDRVARRIVVHRRGGGAPLLQRVVDIDVGPADAVLVELIAEPEQPVHHRAIVGDQRIEIVAQRSVVADRVLLRRGARAPGVRNAAGGDHADPPRTKLAHQAKVQIGRPVRRNVGVALEQGGARIGQLRHLRRGDNARAVRRIAQEIGQVALARIIAEPVGLRAVIGVAELARGLGINAQRSAEGDEILVRNRLGGQVDDTAAELAGIVDRIGLLNQRRPDDGGRKDVQRHRPAQRLGAWQRRSVEQRGGVTVAKAAHEDIAVADDRQAGHAGQCTGDVALTGSCDVRGGKDADHLRGGPHGVGNVAADHHDVAARRGVHARRGDFGFLLLLPRQAAGLGIGGLPGRALVGARGLFGGGDGGGARPGGCRRPARRRDLRQRGWGDERRRHEEQGGIKGALAHDQVFR